MKSSVYKYMNAITLLFSLLVIYTNNNNLKRHTFHFYTFYLLTKRHTPSYSYDAAKSKSNQRAPGLKMASPVSCRAVAVFLFLILFISVHCTDNKPKKKKDIRDYNDADMARLLEEWEVSLKWTRAHSPLLL